MLLLSVAVRTNVGYGEANYQEIRKIIMAWLRTSSDRDGGRQERRDLQLKKANEAIRKKDDLIANLQNANKRQLEELHGTQVAAAAASHVTTEESELESFVTESSSLVVENGSVSDNED